MPTPVILQEKLAPSSKTIPVARPISSRPWAIIGGAGLALAIAGFTDVLLMWYPTRFGNLDWEFATFSGTIDALPLGVIGLSLMAAALSAMEKRGALIAASVASLVVFFLLVGVAVLYVLTVLAGFKTLDPSIATAFYRAVAKTSVLAVAYLTLFAWLTWMLARAGRRKGEPA